MKILERYDFDHGRNVATYLARYLKADPISNRLLVRLRDGQVIPAGGASG